MQSAKTFGVVFVALVVVPALCQGAVVQYNDRATWLAAIGGTPDAVEDFEGFVADADFRAVPVAISIGTLGQVGLDQVFRNFVDVSPFEYTDNGGTNHASCYVNYPETGPGSETNVEVVFTAPVTAWGAVFYGVMGGEILAIDVDGRARDVLATLSPTADDTFIGFVADAGERIDMVVFRSQDENPGQGGEGFGADDFGVVWAIDQPEAAIPVLGGVGFVILVGLLAVAGIMVLRSRMFV